MALINGTLTLGGFLDLQKYELKNGAVHKSANDGGIASPTLGQVYFNTTFNRLRTYNGATWDEYGAGIGDVTGPGSSTTGQIAIFGSGTGKAITGYAPGSAGILKTAITTGVASVASLGSDYYGPSQSGDIPITEGGTGASTLGTGFVVGAGTSAFSNVAVNTIATLASPVFTGDPQAPTASPNNNSVSVATTAYVDAATTAIVASTDAMIFKGVIDASANPNYPAADRGNLYKISVAGKIGGASGINVEVGDTILCITDSTAAGNQATVGANWYVAQTNLEASSTTVAGFVALATAAEAKAGSVSTKALTPASMLNFPRMYSAAVGDGSLGTAVGTPIVVTHSLALADRDGFTLNLMNRTTHQQEMCEVASVNANSLNLWGWTTAPTTGLYQVTVSGLAA